MCDNMLVCVNFGAGGGSGEWMPFMCRGISGLIIRGRTIPIFYIYSFYAFPENSLPKNMTFQRAVKNRLIGHIFYK